MDRKQQLMQEAIDNLLSSEAQRELEHHLKENPQEADHYTRLKQVDSILRTAPHERAPERLALTIMARLAQSLKDQEMLKNMRAEGQQEVTEATVQVALTLVTIATLPLLVGVSWMLLNARSNPQAVEAVLQRVAALLLMVIDVMHVMLEQVEATFKEDPKLAMAMLALIPITLLTLVKQVLGHADKDEE